MFHVFEFQRSKKIVFPLDYKKTRPAELQLNRKLAIKDTYGHHILLTSEFEQYKMTFFLLYYKI